MPVRCSLDESGFSCSCRFGFRGSAGSTMPSGLLSPALCLHFFTNRPGVFRSTSAMSSSAHGLALGGTAGPAGSSSASNAYAANGRNVTPYSRSAIPRRGPSGPRASSVDANERTGTDAGALRSRAGGGQLDHPRFRHQPANSRSSVTQKPASIGSGRSLRRRRYSGSLVVWISVTPALIAPGHSVQQHGPGHNARGRP